MMTRGELPMSTTEMGERQDLATLRGLVRNFGAFADAGLFTHLESLFAPRVHVDYSSLNGQAPASVEPAALMREWAAVLPGFDATFHNIDELDVALRGDTAAAGARVCADHFVAGLYWRVAGRYEFVFRRIDGRWRMETLRFLLREEEGTREVFGPAIEAVRRRS